MSLRLGRVAFSIIAPTANVLPFAHLEDGTAVYPLRGAEKDDDADDSDDDSTDDADDEDDEDDKDDDDKSDLSKIADPKDRRIAELSDESAKRRLRNKQLKADFEKTQAELKALKDKDKSESEKIKEELEELKKEREKLATANERGAIERAFLKNNKIKWHNPDAALKLVDLSEVEYDPENGDVSGMADAVKKLAKEHPYLVDTGKDSEDDEGGKGGTPTGGTPGTGKPKGRNAERARLVKRFPVLDRA